MKASKQLCRKEADTCNGMNALSFRLEWAGEDSSSASLVIETLVDGGAIANFSVVATDLYQLALSTLGTGEYQILNCWCGIPECAHLTGGIQVQHLGSTVRWIVGLSAMPRGRHPAVQQFVFHKRQYIEAITAFADQIAAEQEENIAGSGRGRRIVMYSEHRCIQEGGIERVLRGNKEESRMGSQR